ncbi:MAG TPA: enoyl-CoA hydratase/isomerase family protein [Deltaproteobacteria bacterium]|nr:enoyl-CoA hydratase/isomerase family protein [Deltaproteobacteria bacterium]HQI79957.1 enoyl-CoA hydratase/isomerase family protein [Deltaproteobacteria bacterium]
MDYDTILYETLEPGIGVLTLNRPERYNAVSQHMMEELEGFWLERENDTDTRIVLLRGNGEKGFCAGLDMKEALEIQQHMDAHRFYHAQCRMGRLMLKMRQVPQVIVCMVHGAAAGIGFSFALASDLRVITTDARFCAAYINIGFGGADMACSYFLPRMIGAGRAYEFMLTGSFMSAHEAMDLGFASRMVERDALMDTALGLARTMNAKNPAGLRLTKEAVNLNMDIGGLEQALGVENRNQALIYAELFKKHA